jgi:hypothetical protein
MIHFGIILTLILVIALIILVFHIFVTTDNDLKLKSGMILYRDEDKNDPTVATYRHYIKIISIKRGVVEFVHNYIEYYNGASLEMDAFDSDSCFSDEQTILRHYKKYS